MGCICGGLRGSVVTYDLNLRPFLHHFRRFKSASLARAVIPTSAGAHTYVLTVVFGRASTCGLPSTSTWTAIDMWRRTTGKLLEVHRCALGLGASLPAIWRSTCGRAPI